MLRAESACVRSRATCTKATTMFTSRSTRKSLLPSSVRHICEADIKHAYKNRELIGKGTFAKCYLIQMGAMKVCFKQLSAETKYKSLFYTEARILSELCHHNLPWLHAFCDSPNITAIIMTFHPYSQENNRSLNIFDALYGAHQSVGVVSGNEWKQVLLGSTSALVYLQAKDILHNDIKTDNILIERISNGVRALLIDFNKACHSDEGQVYKLSHKEKEKYAKHHPQIAPEVRCGFQKQSFASDMYSFGRVLYKINSKVLKIPCLSSMSVMCLSVKATKRPSANELSTFLANLFVTQ